VSLTDNEEKYNLMMTASRSKMEKS